jgi:hypothetical protein
MNAMKEPALRNFWYPLVASAQLKEGPQAFRLLGEDLVLWRDERDRPVAAPGTPGSPPSGLYQTWESDGAGAFRRVPQLEAGRRVPDRYRLKTFWAQERHGYVWVCLGEPRVPMAELPEATDHAFRAMSLFDETWNTASLGLGTPLREPDPAALRDVTTRDLDPHTLALTAGTADGVQIELIWTAPGVICRTRTAPDGTRQVLVSHAVPLDERSTRFVGFGWRNDRETSEEPEALRERILGEAKADLRLASDHLGEGMRLKMEAIQRSELAEEVDDEFANGALGAPDDGIAVSL